MKWSWKLGEFRGIGVYMHATFLILIGFIVLSHWSAGHSFGKTLEGVGFILSLFGCVVLHEFGHAPCYLHVAEQLGEKNKWPTDKTSIQVGRFA